VINELLKPENVKEIIIDGFPRTVVQAFFLKHLIYKLHEINDKIPIGFKVVQFSVSRQTSIDRQLARGATTIANNEKNQENKQNIVPVRATDISFEAASCRYDIYENSANECMAVLQSENLLNIYDISAEGSFEKVKRRIYDILSKKH
jgi:adenylate kinase family enzyme